MGGNDDRVADRDPCHPTYMTSTPTRLGGHEASGRQQPWLGPSRHVGRPGGIPEQLALRQPEGAAEQVALEAVGLLAVVGPALYETSRMTAVYSQPQTKKRRPGHRSHFPGSVVQALCDLRARLVQYAISIHHSTESDGYARSEE